MALRVTVGALPADSHHVCRIDVPRGCIASEHPLLFGTRLLVAPEDLRERVRSAWKRALHTRSARRAWSSHSVGSRRQMEASLEPGFGVGL